MSPHADIQMDKPLPSLPGQEAALKVNNLEAPHNRPDTPRRATAPEVASPVLSFPSSSLPYRPRTRSPYARGHTRSRSSASSLSAPQMTRAYSNPAPDTSTQTMVRPASPLGPSPRHRSPLRRPSEEAHFSMGSSLDIDQTISENSELDLTPRARIEFDSMPSSPSYSNNQTFPRSRRRPPSPLNPFAFASTVPRSTLRPSTSSPSLAGSQYNESYPSSFSVASSSIPSTPTSFRSRSPSISSLETIPDSPDAEVEAEEIAKLRAAAEKEEKEEQGEESNRRRAGTDINPRSFGLRDKRKRWSVCGAERRGDLNLETIWET